MIKKITIENFQSHKKTELDLSPGLNLIVGSSNAGKTAIIRAIKWVVYNRPLGDSIRSAFAGAKPTIVTIETDDGHTVRKVKSKNETYYEVDGTKLTAVRSNVPKEVSDVLKLKDINFQFQHDKYFLLSESPSSRTKLINDATGLSAADKCIQIAKKLTSDKKKELRMLDTQHMELETEIADLDELLSRVKPLVADYEDIEQQLADIENTTSELKQIIQTILPLQDKIDKLTPYRRLKKAVTRYERLLTQYNTYSKQVITIRQILTIENRIQDISRYSKIQSNIDNYEQIYQKYDKLERDIMNIRQIVRNYAYLDNELKKYVNLDNIIQLLNGYVVKLESLNQLNEQVKSISKLLQRTMQLKRSIRSLSIEINKLQDRFYKESGGVCPVCGQPLPQEVKL